MSATSVGNKGDWATESTARSASLHASFACVRSLVRDAEGARDQNEALEISAALPARQSLFKTNISGLWTHRPKRLTASIHPNPNLTLTMQTLT